MTTGRINQVSTKNFTLMSFRRNYTSESSDILTLCLKHSVVHLSARMQRSGKFYFHTETQRLQSTVRGLWK